MLRVSRAAFGSMVVSVALAGGCTAAAPDARALAAAGTTRVYRCADGFRFVVRPEPQRLWLFLRDRTASIPQVPSSTGVHYTDGRITLRAEGEEVALELNGRVHEGCSDQPDEALWEDAKLRGIDLRAVGQEPGWWLEVDGAQPIVFVSDDGATRLVFPPVAPSVAAGGRTTYESQTNGARIRVEIDVRTCQDSMSGESFPASVTVTLDSRTYRGCGRRVE